RPEKRARRSCARARVSESRSTPSRRPSGALRSRIASAWPPRPTVPSTQNPPGLTASSSRVSASKTGLCSSPTSDPEPRKGVAVLVGEGLLLEALQEALLVPHLEMVLHAQDADVARHGRRLAQELGQHDAALLVEAHALAEEV